MSVVINEFEVVPPEPAAETPAAGPPRGELDLSVLDEELERALRQRQERAARVHAS
jgi:hypothetical protein